jgi:hypothetical protein
MKRKFFYLLVLVCFSVLVTSAGHLEKKCEYACINKKLKEEKELRQAARNSSDFVFPFNAVFSIW